MLNKNIHVCISTHVCACICMCFCFCTYAHVFLHIMLHVEEVVNQCLEVPGTGWPITDPFVLKPHSLLLGQKQFKTLRQRPRYIYHPYGTPSFIYTRMQPRPAQGSPFCRSWTSSHRAWSGLGKSALASVVSIAAPVVEAVFVGLVTQSIQVYKRATSWCRGD